MIAEVLTTSAKKQNAPTAHRMIISSRPLSVEVIERISPHLYLNTRQVYIPKADFERIAESNPEYQPFLADIQRQSKEICLLSFSEKKFETIFEDYNEFRTEKYYNCLAEIRQSSIRPRNNKVGQNVEQIVHDHLKLLKCFEDGDTTPMG